MEGVGVLAAINPMGIVIACVIGAVCGWLAGQIMKGRGLGILGNIVVGIVGGLLFSFLFGSVDIGLGSPLVNQILGGTIGAVGLLFLISLVKKAQTT